MNNTNTPTTAQDSYDLHVIISVVKVESNDPNAEDVNVMDALHAHLIGELIEVDLDDEDSTVVLYEIEDVNLL